MTAAPAASDAVGWPADVTVAIWAPEAATPLWWASTARALPRAATVAIGAPDPGTAGPGPFEAAATVAQAPSAARFVEAIAASTGGHVLAVTAAVIPPQGLLERAYALMGEDPRVGTISFLTGEGGLLGLPDRHEPSPLAAVVCDADAVTTRLRTLSPTARFVDLPFAIGPVVLVSESLLATCGPLHDAPSGTLRAALADLSLRSRARGFAHLADFGTFVRTQSSDAHDRGAEPSTPRPLSGLTESDERWLFGRHRVAPSHVRSVADGVATPIGTSLNVARVKLRGLRVLLDGRSLSGPHTGTQTATMHLAEGLGRHPEVAEVSVAVVGDLPDYAAAPLSGDRVRVHDIGAGGLGACGTFDVGHRPSLPGGGYSPAEWRGVADRHVVTLFDLIAYDIGDYFPSPEGWHDFRALIRRSAKQADAVVVISRDVAGAVRGAALPVDPSRVFVVPLGTDHVDRPGDACRPETPGVAAAGEKPYLLCLGTNYACRNRDVAVGAWRQLRARGYDLGLMFVGASVPFGTPLAAQELGTDDAIPVELGTVSVAERNWLLSHAALVLCPSSADGFGFVPFEAARAGTPSLSVSFGPFREFGGETPVWAATWSPAAFADAAQRLLDDPVLAERQRRARLTVGEQLTWENTADALVRLYRDLLARPPAVADDAWAATAASGEPTSELGAPTPPIDSAGTAEGTPTAHRISSWFRRG